jgi:DNA-binding HxlR family transcriptional regulator
MKKSSFADRNCAVAQTLERVGEWWTLLILQNAFCGMTRFDQFRNHLDIASNVLANRLAKLTKAGILDRRSADDDGRAYEYRLTKMGLDLYPVIIALTNWGERWVPDPKGPRIKLVDRKNGKPVPAVTVRSMDGRTLNAFEVRALAGPGADRKTLELLSPRSRPTGVQFPVPSSKRKKAKPRA